MTSICNTFDSFSNPMTTTPKYEITYQVTITWYVNNKLETTSNYFYNAEEALTNIKRWSFNIQGLEHTVLINKITQYVSYTNEIKIAIWQIKKQELIDLAIEEAKNKLTELQALKS